MPLLDHFHPPLHGPHHWEGFHHAWATMIAGQLNMGVLPKEYFAEPEICIGPEFEVDVATMERSPAGKRGRTALLAVSKPKFALQVDFSHLEGCEVRVYRDLGGADLCAAIELISPANKDRVGTRRMFAAKCAGYLRNGVGVMIIDSVTSRRGNLHEELFKNLEAKGRGRDWKSPTGLNVVSYRAATFRDSPRVEVWPEPLTLGKSLPKMPLWLSNDLWVSLNLEESYLTACEFLRISA
jgi:Protein of unknown function (DUF4058)